VYSLLIKGNTRKNSKEAKVGFFRWLRFGLFFGLILGCSLSLQAAIPRVNEDSLQALLQREPENPHHWMGLAQVAVQGGQYELARGYFDEAIRVSGRSGSVILQVGEFWMGLGQVDQSLPYLMPNLLHLEESGLNRLEGALQRQSMFSVKLTVLRHHGLRHSSYYPVHKEIATLAYRLGQWELCFDVLNRFAHQLDAQSARNLFILGLYLNKPPSRQGTQALMEKFPGMEIALLGNLSKALAGEWGPVREWLAKQEGSPAYKDLRAYLKALSLSAADRADEAEEQYEVAMGTTWPVLRHLAFAELYKHYSITGDGYKAERLWDDIKEQVPSPSQTEFLGFLLEQRGYEKQARYLYRRVFRSDSADARVLKNLWEDMVDKGEGAELESKIKGLLTADSLDCDANQLAMQYYRNEGKAPEVVNHGRNVVLYCFEVVEPYFDLATALLALKKAEEAKFFFSKYVKVGGDKTRVPSHLR
jgi:tetratricopeptide (TPR) repeat protein